MHKHLEALSFEANRLAKVARGDITPNGWASSAYCTNVHNAFLLNIDDPDFKGARAACQDVIRKAQASGTSENSFKALQRSIYKAISLVKETNGSLYLFHVCLLLQSPPPLKLAICCSVLLCPPRALFPYELVWLS